MAICLMVTSGFLIAANDHLAHNLRKWMSICLDSLSTTDFRSIVGKEAVVNNKQISAETMRTVERGTESAATNFAWSFSKWQLTPGRYSSHD